MEKDINDDTAGSSSLVAQQQQRRTSLFISIARSNYTSVGSESSFAQFLSSFAVLLKKRIVSSLSFLLLDNHEQQFDITQWRRLTHHIITRIKEGFRRIYQGREIVKVDLIFRKLPNTLDRSHVCSDMRRVMMNDGSVDLKDIDTSNERSEDDDKTDNKRSPSSSLVVVSYVSSRLKPEIRAVPFDQYLEKYDRVLIVLATLASQCSDQHIEQYLGDLEQINEEIRKQTNGLVRVMILAWNDDNAESVMLQCDWTEKLTRTSTNFLRDITTTN